jgi:uncharacterized membrane protein
MNSEALLPSNPQAPRVERVQSGIPPIAARDRGANVHGAERIGSGLLGSLFVLWGARRDGAVGALAIAGGMGLLARAATGRCAIKRVLEPSPFAREIAQRQGWRTATATSASVTIGRPREEVYKLWRDFNNLPLFMAHIDAIEVIDPQRSRWVVKAPMGETVGWTSHIVDDVENERIAWESEGGAAVSNMGRVEFRDAPGDRGTEVSAMIAYQPPFGEAGRLLGPIFREVPEHQMRDSLRRLKQIMETGEVTVSQMQPET